MDSAYKQGVPFVKERAYLRKVFPLAKALVLKMDWASYNEDIGLPITRGPSAKLRILGVPVRRYKENDEWVYMLAFKPAGTGGLTKVNQRIHNRALTIWLHLLTSAGVQVINSKTHDRTGVTAAPGTISGRKNPVSLKERASDRRDTLSVSSASSKGGTYLSSKPSIAVSLGINS